MVKEGGDARRKAHLINSYFIGYLVVVLRVYLNDRPVVELISS